MSSFAYDKDNPVQYTVTLKTETVTEYTFSESGYASDTRTIVTGFAVRVRVYYGDSETEYMESSLFSNVRGGDIHVL
ncbi:hypothetical protein SDC9_204385 [bioreactor metagenome]|uniref:Uncharacterized protein n=1 Tax=bioreactor metagenome TaxID=1076179 RepID=A0A645J8B1_9ZZZZ